MYATGGLNYTDGGVNKSVNGTNYSNGWGKVTQSVDPAGAKTNFSYDSMGYLQSRTNPFPQNGSPGPSTSYQYDALGRPTVTTLPDGSIIQISYSGISVTITDEVGRKTQRQYDGLGRLITLTEQDPVTGALTQSTTYGYNYFDELTSVNQGGQVRS